MACYNITFKKEILAEKTKDFPKLQSTNLQISHLRFFKKQTTLSSNTIIITKFRLQYVILKIRGIIIYKCIFVCTK